FFWLYTDYADLGARQIEIIFFCLLSPFQGFLGNGCGRFTQGFTLGYVISPFQGFILETSSSPVT
ncbi:MAG: hypothetical protein ACQESX_05580, partial [Bacteroidota bacterium]